MTQPTSRSMAFPAVGLYLVLSLAVLLGILHRTGGHFLYTLDDPYIHLALAGNIAHGHYGINAGEAASPSSSALWPLLLVPFADKPSNVYLPLLWNLLFGAAGAWLIGSMMDRWPSPTQQRTPLARWKLILIATLLIFVTNLVGLTFTGMEHVLQGLLAISCAIAFTEALAGRPLPSWCLAAAVIGPAVRYENLSITLAMAILLVGMRRPKTAAALLACTAVPLIGFSLFLHSRGLPLLPTSVIFKAGMAEHGGSTILTLLDNLRLAITDAQRWPVGAMLGIFSYLFWKEHDRVRRCAFLGIVVVLALQILAGPFGWFHRYEIYSLSFAVPVFLYVAAERRMTVRSRALILLFLGNTSIWVFVNSPLAADGIYGQQYQMHRFATEFYHGRIAVNDIGLMSYRKPADDYILDIVGLASLEAARQPIKDGPWLEAFAQRNRVTLVMMYPVAFMSIVSVPTSWEPLGQMCLLESPVSAAKACVDFYSTTPQSHTEILAALHQFVKTLPKEDSFTFSSDQADDESDAALP